jgi:hypothetical protein
MRKGAMPQQPSVQGGWYALVTERRRMLRVDGGGGREPCGSAAELRDEDVRRW